MFFLDGNWSGTWQPDWKSLFGAGGRKPASPVTTPVVAGRVAQQPQGFGGRARWILRV